jgi:hypothetical protein
MSYQWSDPACTPGLTPELRLLAAIMAQAVKDARSRRPDVREEALQFLHDPSALDWWSAALDLSDEMLERHIRSSLKAQP